MPRGTALPRPFLHPSLGTREITDTNTDFWPFRHSPLKEAELAVLRKQYEGEGQFVGVQTKFNYAWGLIKSDKRQEQQLGVRLLTG